MADVKFSQFTDGDQCRIGDIVVGLRGGVNYRFDFPSDGFKDSSGNYIVGYDSVGAAAVNYPNLTNSLTTLPVVYGADGADADIDLSFVPKGAGNLILDGLNWPTSDGAANTVLYTDGSGQLGWTTAAFPVTVGASGTIVRSNGTSWVASTSTFADTYAINTILYNASANTVSGLATANSAVLVTGATGAPVMSGTMTNGQLIIGSTGATPTAATLTAGTGISIANAAASITINTTGGGLASATIAGTSQAAAVNTTYIALNAGQTTLTLPAVYAVNDRIALIGSGANTGGWIVTASAGDTIMYNGTATSAGGTLTSAAAAGQTVEVVCDVVNASWVVVDTVNTTLTTA